MWRLRFISLLADKVKTALCATWHRVFLMAAADITAAVMFWAAADLYLQVKPEAAGAERPMLQPLPESFHL